MQRKIAGGSRFFMLTEERPSGIVSVKGNLIEDLYVLPEFQSRGFGTLLLRYAVAQCTGIPTLWILENNHRAGKLYLREGFRKTGRRNTVTNGLDEIEYAMY